MPKADYVANGAPEFFAGSVRSVDIIGPNARVTFQVPRWTANGAEYLEPVCSVVLPLDALPAAALLFSAAGSKTSPLNNPDNDAAPDKYILGTLDRLVTKRRGDTARR